MPAAYDPAQLTAFNTAPQATEAQKQALLQAVAQAGSAGAAAYQQAQEQNQELQRRAIAQASGAASTAPIAASALTQPIAQDFAMRQADIAQGRQTFEQDIARQQHSGSLYFDEVSRAIPLVERRTKAAVEAIIRQQEEAEAERQMQLQLQQLQLQAQREAIAAARAMRGAAGRSRASEEAEAAAAARAEGRNAKTQSTYDSIIARFGGPDTNEAIAFDMIINGASQQDVIRQLSAYGRDPSAIPWNIIIQATQDWQSRLGGTGPDQLADILFGVTGPAAPRAPAPRTGLSSGTTRMILPGAPPPPRKTRTSPKPV